MAVAQWLFGLADAQSSCKIRCTMHAQHSHAVLQTLTAPWQLDRTFTALTGETLSELAEHQWSRPVNVPQHVRSSCSSSHGRKILIATEAAKDIPRCLLILVLTWVRHSVERMPQQSALEVQQLRARVR